MNIESPAMRAHPSGLIERLKGELQVLLPASFAFVMATGIISIAATLLDMPAVSWTLLWVGLGAWLVLSLMFVLRLVFHFPQMVKDLRDPMRGPGFFTTVAGTCVMGSALFVVAKDVEVARAFWFLGIGLWVLVMYAFFAAVISNEKKASLETGLNGAWLIASVATQAVAALGGLLASEFSTGKELVYFFSLCMYLAGVMLYLNIIALIFYRITFLPLSQERLSPSYWINMGAVAIATLAGSTLVLHSGDSQLLSTLKPFLIGFTLFFWSAGTWWIPLLLILGVWRHVVRRFPLSYDPSFWAGVFPLGMYSAATFRLAQAAEVEFLVLIPRYFIFVAYAAWGLVFVGMVRVIGRSLLGSGD